MDDSADDKIEPGLGYSPPRRRASTLRERRRHAGRWKQLGIFVYCTAAAQAQWIMYTSAPEATREVFGVPLSLVTLLTLTFAFMFLPGSMMAHEAAKDGTRGTIVMAAAVVTLGSVVKVAGALVGGHTGYAATFVGQSLAALMQPYFVNFPAALASQWFLEDERDTAATLGLLGNVFGQAVGAGLSPWLAGDGSDDSDSDAGLLRLTTMMLGGALVGLVLACCGFKNAPPSSGDDSDGDDVDDGVSSVSVPAPSPGKFSALLHVWMELLSDRNFFCLNFGFSIGLSVFGSLLTLLARWTPPCGFSQNVAGMLGATCVLCGIPGALVFGVLMDKTKAYQRLLRLSIAGAVLGSAALVVALPLGNAYVLYGAIGVLGACILAAAVVSMESAVIYTEGRHNPEISTGCMFCTGNYLSVAVTYAMERLLVLQGDACPSAWHSPTAWLLVGCMAAAGAAVAAFTLPRRDMPRNLSQHLLPGDYPEAV